MAANKRTDKQKENDRLFIADQFLKGFTVREIAANLNSRNEVQELGYTLAHSQVAYDIKKILEDWRETRKHYIDLIIERDLMKLEIIERECWEAWERSKSDKKKTTISGGQVDNGRITGGKVQKREMEDSNGDPKYLDRIFECMNRRRDLLGYGQAQKVEHTHNGTVNVGIQSLSQEEIEKERERIKKNWSLKAV